ncbi:MAG: Alcohol dehydrogenase zinc-binding domain protein [Herbinix sp.]|jgi:L-iditol 2-dehydrogenase|nr:Alcohol dehydrogenase zinc-binding domain protein [Herbinix sp.]
MKAIVYEQPNVLNYRDVTDITPKENEVKIRVKACGICGSDVHGYLGITGRRIPPMIMGHEFAGEITELGSKIEKYKKGDRVAVYPVDFCGHCEMCRKGDVHLCLNKRAFGVLTIDGALAEYICIPEKCCFPIREDVSYAIGSLVEPLAVAYRGVAHAGDLTGKTVLLIGTGTIGLLALACVKLKNAGKIIVSDISDNRLQVAREMGADALINPSKEDFKARIMEETKGVGVDVAIEAVGAAPTVQQAMSALTFAGKAIWIGNNKPMIEINMQEIVTKELSVHGSFLYGYKEFETVVELLNENKINVAPLISAEIHLQEAPEYFEKLAHTPGNLIKVIVVDK